MFICKIYNNDNNKQCPFDKAISDIWFTTNLIDDRFSSQINQLRVQVHPKISTIKKRTFSIFFQVICIDGLNNKIRYKQVDEEIFSVSVLMSGSIWLSRLWMTIGGTGTATVRSASSLSTEIPVISSISLFPLTPSSRSKESLLNSCLWISISLSSHLSCSGSLSLWFDSGSLSSF